MPAPLGNKNAQGGSGGYGDDSEIRKLRQEAKRLALEWAIESLKGNNKEDKRLAALKILGSAFPVEHSGEDGGAIQIELKLPDGLRTGLQADSAAK